MVLQNQGKSAEYHYWLKDNSLTTHKMYGKLTGLTVQQCKWLWQQSFIVEDLPK